MATLMGAAAIGDALAHGRALMKFISANDVGATGAHQSGFYLPKAAWRLFTPHPPIEGRNDKHDVTILWPDGSTTNSVVTWYGQGTRREYRLTRFGRGFAFLDENEVGNLLVIVPSALDRFTAHILTGEEDIEDLQAELGVEIVRTWGILAPAEELEPVLSENDCLEKRFANFVDSLSDFPPGFAFTSESIAAMRACSRGFDEMESDERLMRTLETEYRLFRRAEAKLCGSAVQRGFSTIDDFLSTAHTILNRRKSRAGRSLENHFGLMLESAGIPFAARPKLLGEPDILIPSVEKYLDESYPREAVFIVGVKTTCKDRWRQVSSEVPDVKRKHILTTQQGISSSMLGQMKSAGITLVVPKPLHAAYPQDRPMQLETVESFLQVVKRALPN